MSNAASRKPLAKLSTDELVAWFESLGKAYTAYTAELRDNGVDGALVADYVQKGTLDELFADLNITKELHRNRLKQSFGTAPSGDAFAVFDSLLAAMPASTADLGDKMLTNVKDFKFGGTHEFMHGFDGELTRAMRQEYETNDSGKWLGEFLYVVENAAIGVPDEEKDHPARMAADAKFKAVHPSLKAIGKRDLGNESKVLDDFFNNQEAKMAKLTLAEAAAARLYTGPSYQPINAALRTENVGPWATTIALLYSAVLKLSFLSKPARVYRGVKEDTMKLPDAFLDAAADDFAGGVELAFMSTTLDPEVALFYTGKGPGSIFVIDFGMASRGASLQFLSQFPHEAELLFPPKTMLECKNHDQRGNKRLVVVAPTVSTARPDTSGIDTPDDVPKKLTPAAAATQAEAQAPPSLRALEAGKRGEFGPLVALLSDSGADSASREEAAGVLSRLAMAAEDSRDAMTTAVLDASSSSSIEEHLQQMRQGQPADVLWSLVSLWGLARSAEDSQVAITTAGGITPLVELTRSGTEDAKEWAAAAQWALAANADNQVAIASAGGISPLIELTRSGTDGAKQNAVGALAFLAANADNQAAIVTAGGIAPVVELTRSGTSDAKELAVAALWFLACNADSQVMIAAVDGIAPLVELTRSGTDGAKQNAVGALRNLAANADNQVAIASAGGISPLIELTRSGTDNAKQNAAGALWMLSRNVDCQVTIAAAGGISPLIELTRSGTDNAKENAAVTLNNLAGRNNDNQVAIAAAGGIVPLVELTRSGTEDAKGRAAQALRNLAVDNDDNQVAIAAAGGIVSLVELTRSGTAMAKESAAAALEELAANAVNKAAIEAAGGISLPGLLRAVLGSQHDDLRSLLLEPSMAQQLVRCSVRRHQQAVRFMGGPGFDFFMSVPSTNGVHCMWGQKHARKGYYSISLDQNIVGKVRSDRKKMEYHLYDDGATPESKETGTLRRELLYVNFTNSLRSRGPSAMEVVVPRVDEMGVPVIVRPTKSATEGLAEKHKSAPMGPDVITLKNVNLSPGMHYLESCKNIQLHPKETTGSDDNACFQMCKAGLATYGHDSFDVDFKYPFSCLQAFAFALVLFDNSSSGWSD